VAAASPDLVVAVPRPLRPGLLFFDEQDGADEKAPIKPRGSCSRASLSFRGSSLEFFDILFYSFYFLSSFPAFLILFRARARAPQPPDRCNLSLANHQVRTYVRTV